MLSVFLRLYKYSVQKIPVFSEFGPFFQFQFTANQKIHHLTVGIFLKKIAGSGYSQGVYIFRSGRPGNLLEYFAVVFLAYAAFLRKGCHRTRLGNMFVKVLDRLLYAIGYGYSFIDAGRSAGELSEL